MALDFPSGAIVGTIYTGTNGAVYTFDGIKWRISSQSTDIIPSINDLYNLGSTSSIWNNLFVGSAFIKDITSATSTNTGALQVTGGAGIGGSLYVGGPVYSQGIRLTGNEIDPVFTASSAVSITATNITNWNTAYSWGNHATRGYLTATVSSHLLPGANSLYDLGSTSSQWRSLYVSTNTIYIGGNALSVVDGNLSLNGISAANLGQFKISSNNLGTVDNPNTGGWGGYDMYIDPGNGSNAFIYIPGVPNQAASTNLQIRNNSTAGAIQLFGRGGVQVVVNHGVNEKVFEFADNGQLFIPNDIIGSGVQAVVIQNTASGVAYLELPVNPSINSVILANQAASSATVTIRVGDFGYERDWTFHNAGRIVFPNGTTSTGSTVYVPYATSSSFTVNTQIGQGPFTGQYRSFEVFPDRIKLPSGNGYIQSGDEADLWRLDSGNKYLEFPNISRIHYGDGYYLSTGTLQVDVRDGGIFQIRLNDSNKTWTFDNNGDLTLPGGGDIQFNSSATSYIYGVTGIEFANATTQTTAFIGNAATVDIMNTNGLDYNYSITFVENRSAAQDLRADVDLTFNSWSNTLGVGKISVNSTDGSTSTITGALTVAGGVGIQGDLYAGNIYTNGVQLTAVGGGTNVTNVFMYNSNASYSMTQNVEYKIPFDTTTTGHDAGDFQTTSSQFIPQIAGWYLLETHLNFGGVWSGNVNVSVYKNNNQEKLIGSSWIGNGGGVGGSAFVYSNGSTDIFEIRATQTSGGVQALEHGVTKTWFQATWMKS